MNDTIVLNTDPAFEALDEARELLAAMTDRAVPITAASVSGRRSAAAERGQTKAELSYISHLLEKARIAVNDEHHKITLLAKRRDEKS